MSKDFDVEEFVRNSFQRAKLPLGELSVRDFPEETIVVVHVEESDFQAAIELANQLDATLAERDFSGFVTVKKQKAPSAKTRLSRVQALDDEAVTSFVQLLTSRARTTEVQPSLEYIADVQNTIAAATSERHHLVFGRRGTGKTALLAEAKRRVTDSGNLTVWLNAHTHRHESGSRFFLYFVQRICEEVQTHLRAKRQLPRALVDASKISDETDQLLIAEQPDERAVARLVQRVHRMLQRFLVSVDCQLYVFLDDFHYLKRDDQPITLDLIHGCVRDCNAWLKVASIQHLTRWYDASKHYGLESGHDAAPIDLDVTLHSPASAKQFLERVLDTYARASGIRRLTSVFSPQGALDRLILASGSVPRDYLSLCSGSIVQARQRKAARFVGVEDVNKAAGEAKQKKIAELEDDAAGVEGQSNEVLLALEKTRRFCIESKGWTYFRVAFRDKEEHADEYQRLQLLVDMRLVHLVDPSVSDERKARRRFEVYMLDLSQFADQRLRRGLRVLDFVKGHFVVKETGTSRSPQIGDTPNRRLSLLRRSPAMALSVLRSAEDE